jgi:hypothetical protein
MTERDKIVEIGGNAIADAILEHGTFDYGLIFRAALAALEQAGYAVVPMQRVDGAVHVATLPPDLGAVTGMRVEGDRLVCDTESGINFVAASSPKE